MKWSAVGEWLKGNAGQGAALVGSLLTGNVPAAVAAGVSLVSSATGHNDPAEALAALQTDPSTVVKLRELANVDAAAIRDHLRAMEELRLRDEQAEHEQAQLTTRAGDVAEDPFVRRSRPGMAWVSLIGSYAYVFMCTYMGNEADPFYLATMLTPALSYMGLRGLDKTMGTIASWKIPAVVK